MRLAADENHLIELLPRRERQRMLARCEPAPLVLDEVLCDPSRTARYVYFPVDGVISMLAPTAGHPGLEVAMVGREGMLGAHWALGVPHPPLAGVVRASGAARRMTARAFVEELAGSVPLRRCVHRYLHVRLLQLARTAACLHFHPIEERLARWLMMCQDRVQADDLQITHGHAADRLGVRRVGITMAASRMQRNGLIAYHRGILQVLDRPGLLAVACDCYAADCKAYDGLL